MSIERAFLPLFTHIHCLASLAACLARSQSLMMYSRASDLLFPYVFIALCSMIMHSWGSVTDIVLRVAPCTLLFIRVILWPTSLLLIILSF